MTEQIEAVKLETIGDVMTSEKFREYITEFIEKTRKARKEILNSSPRIDARIKSDAFGRLDKAGFLNFDYIFHQFELILQKKSELPAAERMFIQSLVDACIRRTVDHYQKHN